MAITYKALSDALLEYSGDKLTSSCYILTKENEYVTKEFTLSGAKYFRISALTGRLYIKNISLCTIDNDYKPTESKYIGYRANPIKYDNELVSGLTTRTIPSKVEIENGKYVVKEVKSYTYYDRNDAIDYIIDHGRDETYFKMVLTDPLDVANYYILYNDFPVNYMDMSDAKIALSEGYIAEIRCISTYSRTNGYVRSIPIRYDNGPIIYYELDINLGTYTITNRGSGRLVVFTNGFDSDGYDYSPVIVYTDDHYATFTEYNNLGTFLERFNAEQKATPYDWCKVETITNLLN